MKFYKIEFDVDHFQYLHVDTRKIKDDQTFLIEGSRLNCEGVPRENWEPPVVYSVSPKLPEPDVWAAGSGGGFAVTQEVLDKFGDILKLAGQLLPFTYKGRTFFLCNILQKIECDPQNTAMRHINEQGRPVMKLSPILTAATIPSSSLFKVPFNQFRSTILCLERTCDPKTEFHACVLENKMKGVIFTLVWEGEEPIN